MLVRNRARPSFQPAINRLNVIFIQLLLTALVKLVDSMSQDHCYTDIGCFPLSREFYHPRHRPFNVRPWHRNLIGTQFELFNRYHPEGYMLVPWDRFNLEQSHFDPLLETKVIVPGWLDNINRALWVRKLRDALLWTWAPVNIIVVRWRNFTPYTIATANTRVVGAELANLVKFLEHELQYERAYYHIIGHSLGAHIGGYTGDRMPGLGRITALDPARPFFQGMPKSVRLDRGDAKFVDAIHSDFTPENAIFLLMSFGMTTPIGHLDFYPNGPPLFQPGCVRDTLTSVQDGIAKGLNHNSLSVAFLEATRYLTACDHQRSHEWFIESITNRECLFVGVRCSEFEGMINGRCTCDDSRSACAIMGIHADQMYLNGVHEDVWPVRGPPAAPAQLYQSIHSPHTRNHAKTGAKPKPPVSAPIGHPAQVPLRPLDTSLPISHPFRPQYSHDGLPVAQQLDLELPQVPSEFAGPLGQLNALIAAAALIDPALGAVRPDQLEGSGPQPQLSREEILSQLKQNINNINERPEPLIHGLTQAELETAASKIAEQQRPRRQANETGKAPQAQADLSAEASEVFAHGDELGERDADADDHLQATPSARQMSVALQDDVFVQFLRANLLLPNANDQDALQTLEKRNDDGPATRQAANQTGDIRRQLSPEAQLGRPAQFGGHPLLVSAMHRETENWYEGTSRWFLKTNNRPKYCSNQYQLLVFLGPLSTTSGQDRLRANLIISLIGSRGQLLNQRFIPRGSTLNSFTMQPFFILLEGSYSLGQIHSVAVAWEARSDPDPIQATVTFHSSPALEAIQAALPAYKTRNNPWVPRTSKYDKSAAFEWTQQRQKRAAKYSGPQRRAAGSAQPNSPVPKSARKRLGLAGASPAGASRRMDNSLDLLMGDQVLVSASSRSASSIAAPASDYDYGPGDYETSNVGLNGQSDEEEEQEEEAQQTVASELDAQTILTPPNDPSYRDQQSKMRQKYYIADDDSDSMFQPLLQPPPVDQLVPLSQLSVEDALQQADPQTMLRLHNLNMRLKEIHEDSIVINQVIVSPIQAHYGRHGRNARAFCPPGSFGQRLSREQTIRLAPSLFSRCHLGQLPAPSGAL